MSVLVLLAGFVWPLAGSAQATAPDSSAAQVRVQPVSEHVPVLLVPGWKDDADGMSNLEARFEAAGWPVGAVEAIAFENPVGSNQDHAVELADIIDRFLEAIGSDSIDVVAHSMGGLAVRRYLVDRIEMGLPVPVRRVAFLATPHDGTVMAHVAWGLGSQEMEPDSDFLVELNRRPLVPEGVRAMAVWTPIDSHIVPPESAFPPGLRAQRVCCPTHRGLLRDEETFELVRLFLEDGIRAPRTGG